MSPGPAPACEVCGAPSTFVRFDGVRSVGRCDQHRPGRPATTSGSPKAAGVDRVREEWRAATIEAAGAVVEAWAASPAPVPPAVAAALSNLRSVLRRRPPRA